MNPYDEKAKRTLTVTLPKGNPLEVIQVVEEDGTNRGYMTLISPKVTKVELIFKDELPPLVLEDKSGYPKS